MVIRFLWLSGLFLLCALIAPAVQQSTTNPTTQPTAAPTEEPPTDPIVETTLGKIQGKIIKSQKGADILAFRGIPYAQPPLGKLRFAAPVPVQPWSATRKASADALICPQPGIQLFMSEDCLYINVFTRNLNAKAPVMVYIHGGANVLGSGHSQYEAGPQYLLDHDVVLVAFNYRLGALGFLSTRTPEAPGNYGYLDQVLALKWVKEHISRFGGDPDLVTIFGLSAGSMAVTLHLASPLSQGLFQRAIAMSGSATNHYDIDNVYWTRKLAREVSCPMYNPQDVVDCLRAASWKDIINVCSNWEPYSFYNMKWNYEVDNHFLIDTPTMQLARSRYQNVTTVPLLVGITKNELDFTVYDQVNMTGLLNDISLNFDLYAPELFLYKEEEATQKDALKSKRMQQFYLGNETHITKQNLVSFGEMFSDSIITHGVHRLVELLRYNTKIYYYRFDYAGEKSLYLDEQGKPRGVGHADDIHYIMPGLWYGAQLKPDHPDMFMVERMTRWWTNFAKHGTPTLLGENITWEPVSADRVVTLYNDKTARMDKEPYAERYQLWDNMFPVAFAGAEHLKISMGICIMALSFLRIIF